MHTSNLYEVTLQDSLAKRLSEMAGMEQAFLGNSGAEANEAAIKIARLYGHGRDINKPTIIVMEDRSTAAPWPRLPHRQPQSAGGLRTPAERFLRAPYNDVGAIDKIAENTNEVVAMLVEPIQGEGGIRFPTPTTCRAAPHVRCPGLATDAGRSADGQRPHRSQFRLSAPGILPDVVTTAKGLGNGSPSAHVSHAEPPRKCSGPATTARRSAAIRSCARPPTRYSTRSSKTSHRPRRRTRRPHAERVQKGARGDNQVVDIRGLGLMIGIELETRAELVKAASRPAC